MDQCRMFSPSVSWQQGNNNNHSISFRFIAVLLSAEKVLLCDGSLVQSQMPDLTIAGYVRIRFLDSIFYCCSFFYKNNG